MTLWLKRPPRLLVYLFAMTATHPAFDLALGLQIENTRIGGKHVSSSSIFMSASLNSLMDAWRTYFGEIASMRENELRRLHEDLRSYDQAQLLGIAQLAMKISQQY